MRYPVNKKLKIAHITAEVSPYSKVGGLGDVGYALPKAIHRLGHEVIVISPYYGKVRTKNIKKESIEPGINIEIDGKEYPLSFRKHVTPENFIIYFIVNEELYGSSQTVYRRTDDEALRWIFFDQAALELLKLIGFEADVIHAHDWHSGLVANYLKIKYKMEKIFEKTATIYTIHNLFHQGTFRWQDLPEKKTDKGTGWPPVQNNYRKYINFTKRGILFSDVISTVSERYAKEIMTPKFGARLDPFLKRRKKRVYGIINGIDYEVVNPAFDKNIYLNYDFNSLDKKRKNKTELQKEVGLTIKKDTPLLGVVNRLTEQKGFKLIMEAMPTLLKMKLQIVIVGSGNKDYIKFFRMVARKHRDKVGVYSPFTEKMASRVYAGSDLYLMPSRWEPCGISQLISLRYGSIPIVHSVGGLHDTVTEFDPVKQTGNGFKFSSYHTDEFLVAIAQAMESYKYKDSWIQLMYRAMKQSFSWDLPAKKYVELYKIAMNIKKKGL